MTEVQEGLWVGTVPCSSDDLETLWAAGVRAVVTLNQRWEPQIQGGVSAACSAFGLEQLWLPTPDFSAPSQRSISAAVAFIEEHVGGGRGVYVHCNGGKGRSVVCCLAFCVKGGAKPLEAYEALAAKRKIAPLHKRMLGLPHVQMRALQVYERGLRPKSCTRAVALRGTGANKVLPL